MPAVLNELAVTEKLRALRETTLPDAWVAAVMASDDDVPPGAGLPEGLWAAYIYVVAYRYGHLKGEMSPSTYPGLTEALDQTVAHIESHHPGLLDAPSAVAFAGPAFEDSTGATDAPPVMDAVEETPSADIADPDTSWYGVSRLVAGTMLLMGREGEAMPALQLRLYNVLDQEIFNRMLPFGDALFVVSALLENLDNAFDFHQKSLKVGTLSPRMRASMETIVEVADTQLQKLRETLRAAG